MWLRAKRWVFESSSQRECVMPRLIAALAMLSLFLGACSTDPTTTEEYRELTQRLVDAEQRLADTEGRLADTEERLTDTEERLSDTSQQLADVTAESDASTSQPKSDTTNGQTINVTVAGLTGQEGEELAGVLYPGEALTDLGREAVGGFWASIESNDFTTTQLVRQADDWPEEPFPYVTHDALLVEPGMYTLVLWTDYGFSSTYGLSPYGTRVPINTDGQGLAGCQHVFEVAGDAQTEVIVGGDLWPDGWDVVCTTT